MLKRHFLRESRDGGRIRVFSRDISVSVTVRVSTKGMRKEMGRVPCCQVGLS